MSGTAAENSTGGYCRIQGELKGLTTDSRLFVIELKTRRVLLAEITRNLPDPIDGFLVGHRSLICDRDGKFTPQFNRILSEAGTKIILTPRQAPDCNAYAERFVLSIKSGCLNRMMLFGETGLRQSKDCEAPSATVGEFRATVDGEARGPRWKGSQPGVDGE